MAPPPSSRMLAARAAEVPGAAAAAAALRGTRGSSPRMTMRPSGRLPCSSLTMLSILRRDGALIWPENKRQHYHVMTPQ